MFNTRFILPGICENLDSITGLDFLPNRPTVSCSKMALLLKELGYHMVAPVIVRTALEFFVLSRCKLLAIRQGSGCDQLTPFESFQ